MHGLLKLLQTLFRSRWCSAAHFDQTSQQATAVRRVPKAARLAGRGSVAVEGGAEAGPRVLPCPKWGRSSFQNFFFFCTFLFFLLSH